MTRGTSTPDRAVSPARILTILLVAVAVVQLLVLGVLLFGFEINAESAPQASFDFEDGTTLVVTHEAGETIPESALEIAVGNESYNGTALDAWSADGAVSAGDAITVGSGADVEYPLRDGDTVEIVWTAGGREHTLASTTLDR